jgi:hypothetical protein
VPGSFAFWSYGVKRLHFLFGVAAGAILGLSKLFTANAQTVREAGRKTWAVHMAEITSATNTRRYEHWIQMEVCNGDFDHLYSPEDRARRRARCQKICGLCRYINSLPLWPDPTYRRPSETVLTAIENEPYYAPRFSG